MSLVEVAFEIIEALEFEKHLNYTDSLAGRPQLRLQEFGACCHTGKQYDDASE